ncbi:MAG: SPFH domain-containing protein [Clostridia bacterium]|nr:SPFH domain-containing protein [Clostridia bacterium]MBQ4157177.1 SPFH domain-containing protein [Clostridia bacterium]
MGLIRAGLNALGGTFASQWKEYFYADALEDNVLATRAMKRTKGRFGGSKREDDNVISDGSVIAVADGQCVMVVDGGCIVEFSAEPGEFLFDRNAEPSLFYGQFSGEKIKQVLKTTFERFSFGGQAGKDQRVYYFNTREIVGNKYGTPSPVPFRVVDRNIGLDVDISLRCFGEYSYRVINPMLFYTNVCGNMEGDFTRDQLDSQLKSELLTALQPAFARISELGVRYSSIPGHTMELADALNDVLSSKWAELRGIEIVSLAVSSVKASEEDEDMIKELQRNAVFRNANMAAAHMVGSQSQAMQDAAKNSAGAFTGFMGMNMAQQAGGVNAGDLFRMGMNQQSAPQAAASGDSWKCACGAVANGKFCPECGSKKPQPQAMGSWKCVCGAMASGKFCPECGAKKPQEDGWTCACGAVNKGKFCAECGSRKPADAPLYRCDKCGWQPADPKNPPRFCPECGDRFDDEDIV